jgi:hypothetical protein
MGRKSGEVPKYLVCVRTLALVGGITAAGATAAGCSSTETPTATDAKQDVYDGGVIGVAIYDGGHMGVAPYDGGALGALAIPPDAGEDH